MAATSMFDTVDALVALISALPAAQTSGDVTVYDGFPAGLGPGPWLDSCS